MNTVAKISQTRRNLKKYLKHDWDTSVIEDLSIKEVDSLYGLSVPQTQGVPSFGPCTPCNFTVNHREIPEHQLHVIYYNFGEKNEPPPKITKTCGEKIRSLYDNDIIKSDDSLLLIFQSPITDTIAKTIEDIYTDGQETLKQTNLSDDVLGANEGLDEPYRLAHFRNIHAFYLDHLAIDITAHEIVPIHESLRKENDIQEVLKKCNCKLHQLPKIMRTDPQAKCMRLAPDDICKITRTSSVGEVVTYRVCI